MPKKPTPNNPPQKEYGFSVPGLVELLPTGQERALDVGCSSGGLGYYLKNNLNYKEVTGIEYSETAAEKAREHLDHVFTGDACELDLPETYKNYFNVITYADVLEHLHDPWSVIARHKRYLKKDGLVAASIPNIKNFYIILNLLAGRFDYTELGLLDKTHIRFFTAETAVELFTKAGYHLVSFHRSVRDSNWHSELNPNNTVNPAILTAYEKIYQKFIQGEDCSADIKQHFGMFDFSPEAIADLFTAQYHLICRK